MVISVENKLAFTSSVEVAVMNDSNNNYKLVNEKLDSFCKCSLQDCYDQPECVKTILKEVYKEKYDSLLDKIKLKLDYLEDLDSEIDQFIEFMKNNHHQPKETLEEIKKNNRKGNSSQYR